MKSTATACLLLVGPASEPEHGFVHGNLGRLLFRMNLLEGTARGERAVEEGRTLMHDGAKAKLSRWLK